MEGIEITTTDTGFSLKICGVEFGDITELINISIEAPVTSTIKLECNLGKFLEKMRAIKYSRETSITYKRESKWKEMDKLDKCYIYHIITLAELKLRLKECKRCFGVKKNKIY